jgi:murein DD-endopeptidase MepM/ murein hydrolase activator NlpD
MTHLRHSHNASAKHSLALVLILFGVAMGFDPTGLVHSEPERNWSGEQTVIPVSVVQRSWSGPLTGESADSPLAAAADAATTAPRAASLNCDFAVSGPGLPAQSPTPFMYKPFDSAWSGDAWTSNMDHGGPKYRASGSVASLGESLSSGLKRYWNEARTVSYDYYWSPSLEWLLGYDGHDGNDFVGGGTIRAVAAGQVVRVQSQDLGGWGRYVDIYHPQGYLTRYAHLASVSVAVTNPFQNVSAGQAIGVMGESGAAKGIHLHLSVYRWDGERWRVTDPFGWDPWRAPTDQGSDPLYACNGEISYDLWVGGWPQGVNGAPGASTAPNVRYMGGWLGEESTNPNDTIPPSGYFTSPSNGSTINSRSVTLSVSASDNAGGSGVREVRFSAKWNDTWYGVGTDSSAPYSLDWDMCSSGVPNGDVELGMEIWDNANNKFVWSEHGNNPHITKASSCEGGNPPGTGSTWNAQFWMNKYLAGYVNWEGTYTWSDYPYIWLSWGTGGPVDGWGGDEFSMRMWRSVYFEGGYYSFETQHDDGVRVWLDGNLIIDAWWNGDGGHGSGRNVSAGNHEVKVEYYEDTGDAHVSVVWYGPGYPRPDNDPPSGRITSPTHLSASAYNPLPIWAEASDDASGVERVEFYAWYCSGGLCDWRLLGTSYSAPYSFFWDWSSIGDNHVWLSIDVYDRTGKRNASAGGWVEVDLDRTKPSVNLIAPSASAMFNANFVPVQAQAADGGAGVAAVQFFVGYTGGASYWQEIGWDYTGADGWMSTWDATAVPDQSGIAFFAYAYDRAGNYEGVASWNHVLDRGKPDAYFYSLGSQSPPTITVRWNGYDGVSGIAGFDIDYQDNSGGWIGWLANTTQTTRTLAGQAGHTYTFRIRARDRAGNVEDWTASSTLVTTAVDCSSAACVSVRNQAGSLVFGGARVDIFSDPSAPAVTYGYADSAGNFVTTALASGTYSVVVASYSDHFLVVKPNVSFPGAMIASAEGATVRHTLSLATAAGQVSEGYFNVVPNNMRYVQGYVGWNASGAPPLDVYISPGTYTLLGTSYADRLVLFKTGVNVAATAATQLHANLLPVGYSTISLSGYGPNSILVIWPYQLHAYSAWFYGPASVATYTLSAGSYQRYFYGKVDAADASQWEYDMTLCPTQGTVTGGGTGVCSADAALAAQATPYKALYLRGETYREAHQFTDSHRNPLWGVWRTSAVAQGTSASRVYGDDQPYVPGNNPEAGAKAVKPAVQTAGGGSTSSQIYPVTRLFDPSLLQLDSQMAAGVYSAYQFPISVSAVPGWYRTVTSIDTGPLKGVVTTTTTFEVSSNILKFTFLPLVRR